VLQANDQSSVVTAGPWTTRDGYVAETSIKLDRLQAKIDRLEHINDALKQDVMALVEKAQQASRFQAFEENLRNGREYKLDELVRSVRDVKARLEQLEGPRTKLAGLTYRSFDVVDKKLSELNALQMKLESFERFIKYGRIAFVSLLVAMAATMVAQLI
jgi:outer membrane murein-binding lipoprotein Lpp